MIPFEEALTSMMRRLGLPEPELIADLTSEWAVLAGEPWASRATPLYVKDGTLVVEGHDGGVVALLRYGVADLSRRLAERFGPGSISAVEVRPPRRNSGPRCG